LIEPLAELIVTPVISNGVLKLGNMAFEGSTEITAHSGAILLIIFMRLDKFINYSTAGQHVLINKITGQNFKTQHFKVFMQYIFFHRSTISNLETIFCAILSHKVFLGLAPVFKFNATNRQQ
jgi:hypothetical protein